MIRRRIPHERLINRQCLVVPTFTSMSEAGSIICISLQGSIEEWDNLSDYRFGCLFWQ